MPRIEISRQEAIDLGAALSLYLKERDKGGEPSAHRKRIQAFVSRLREMEFPEDGERRKVPPPPTKEQVTEQAKRVVSGIEQMLPEPGPAWVEKVTPAEQPALPSGVVVCSFCDRPLVNGKCVTEGCKGRE